MTYSFSFNAILEGFRQNPSEESCGFILEDDSVIFCNNISENPDHSFLISTTDFLIYAGRIKYIFHNHLINGKRPSVYDARSPSKADLEGQKATKVPWLIFGFDGTNLVPPIQIPRTPNNNYLDRDFIWYVNDCYTLVQDYYKFELGIDLEDGKFFDVMELRAQHCVFDTFIEEYGFEEVNHFNDLQNGDLFIADFSGLYRNHLMIYHNGKLLHQGFLSKEENFNNFVNRLQKRLRYVGKSI